MEYINPSVIISKRLLSDLRQRRLNQFNALYLLKSQEKNSTPLPEFKSIYNTAQKLSLNPLWYWWSNEIFKNKYNPKSDSLLIRNYNLVINSKNTNDWIDALIGWEDFTIEFQSACPKGYLAFEEGPESIYKWKEVLNEAFEMIKKTERLLFEEMRLCLNTIVPLKAESFVNPAFSFSISNKLGVLFLTFNKEARVIADTLIHEYYHNRMNLIMESDKILENAYAEEYYAPWNSIQKPLWGILQGSFAYYGIAKFWYNYLEKNANVLSESERKKIESGVIKVSIALQLGCKTLMRYGIPTSTGKYILDGLNSGAEFFFDWTCGLDNVLVGKYYNEYRIDFESWKNQYNKPEAIPENIF